jgi:hypothetical protein
VWTHHDYAVIEGPTRALREGSPERLARELHEELRQGLPQWESDWRDLLVALAPFHHCARELGLDTRRFFDDAAAAGPPSIAEYVRNFGRRRRVRPSGWDFALDRDDDGRLYRHTRTQTEIRAMLDDLRDAGFLRDD